MVFYQTSGYLDFSSSPNMWHLEKQPFARTLLKRRSEKITQNSQQQLYYMLKHIL